MIRKFKFIFVLLFSITLQSQVCSDFPEITATSTTICSGLSTTLSVTYTPPTICNMNITPTTIPLGNPIPGFTYGGLYNGHHYYVYNTPTSWTQGELICRQNGGYLVCINDINENTFVSNLTNNNIWIGLFRDPTTCQFRWLDCMNITFTNWRPGEPNSGPCGEPYTQIIRGCSFGLNTWNNLDDNSANGSCYSNMVPIMEIDPIIYNNPISPTTTYLWSTGATTNSINISPNSTTNYWVDITSGSLTCRKNITINVNPDTPAPTGNPTQVFCANPTPLISDLTATGTAIQWYAAATGGSPLASTTNLVDGATYFASQSLNGCESTTRLAVTVDFNDPQITASAITVCNGTAVTLTASNSITPISNNCSLPTNLQNGLVGYWPFCGNANDESGNGNNGTVNGATLTTDRFGNPNNAYYFSSTGCSTRIDAQVNTNTIQTGLTISIWVLRVGNGCISPRVLEFWPSANPNGPGMAQWGWGNNINTIGIGSITSTGFDCSAGIPVNGNDIWYNIVYTNDGLTGKFYRDGNLITSIPSNGNPILANSAAFGRMNHPAFDNLNGKLDDIGVWNRALSQQEISQLYNSTQISYLWSTGETTETINPTPTVTTTYWVDITVNGVTCRKEITITVNPNIIPTFTQVPTICSGTTLNALPINSTNGIIGTWSPALNNTITTTYTFTPSAGQCATTASMTIIVNPLPTTPTGNAQQSFCAIDGPTINDLVLNTTNVNWYTTATGGSALNSNFPLTNGLILYAAAMDPITLCENPSRYQVQVQVENPQLPIIEVEQEFCIENGMTLGAINTNGTTMNWYDNPTGGSVVPTTYILQNGDVFYGAAINSASGCESTTRIPLEISIINSNLEFNNLITIDDNDLNKELKIEGIEQFPNNTIEVYNRYGNLVWSGINYNNVTNTFNGMANVSGVVSKGSYLPTGTYFFILSYPNDCEKTELKGFIHIDNKL
ncbi:gliding motility-associated C-terminal domain-containing protein [uncultured Flavobacterium sp.]|uniref:Ig-like domain-containing protein n=1 Tax=uncultured Flavobacterium sp. TaxID=165435 RepID=UPI0026129A3B|nr:gliding motility-associated C-terminal domain-containing protein [uncultured Flavobacterium sp.]